MDKVNKTRSIAVDSNNKLVFPQISKLIEANPELGGGNLPDNIQVSDDGYTLSIDTTGGYQPNILLQGTETKISGLSCSIEAVEGIRLNGGGGVNGTVDVNSVLNTNGIHEQNVYTIEPSYSMKGWYLASAIENPYYSINEITFNDLKNKPSANVFLVLLSDTKIPYETAKDISPDVMADESSYILQNLAVGDILTFKNDWNLINAIEIIGIYGNRIEFKYILDNLNENYMPYMFNLQEYGDHILSASVRCFAKPDAGYVEFAGENATAVGGSSQISRGYLSTNVGGRRNNTSGDFSVSIGEDNIVEGKSSVAIGKQNTIKQEENISIGNINEMTANVRQGFIFGGNNKTAQENSVLVGRGLTLNKQNTSSTRTIIGRFNNPAEDGAVVIGTGQGTNDLYNGAIIDRSSCTFRGKQTFEYYNSGDAFTSKHGIISLGSNNNASNAKNGTYMLGGGLIREQQSDTSNTGTRTIVGLFNEDISGNPAFIVGAGANANNRKNIIEAYSDKVNVNGKIIAKDLQCGGTSIGLGSNTTVSSGTYALGAGLKQTTSIGSQVIAGVFNKETVKDTTYGVPVFTVGNGWADNNRSNAIEVYRNLTKIKNNVELNNVKSNNDINIASGSNINLKYGDNTVINIADELTLTSNRISVNGYTTFNDGIFTSSIDGSENSILSLYNNGAGDTQTHLTYDNISLVIGRHDSGADFDFNIDGSFTGYKHPRAGSDPDTSTGFNLSVDSGLNITSANSNSASYTANGISMHLTDSGEDALNNDILINNSTGITITPSLEAQLKHKVGNVHIDGTSISINPAGNNDDWNMGDNYPELLACGHKIEMTNTGIDLYDKHNSLSLNINSNGIRRVSNWSDFNIYGVNTIELHDIYESTSKFKLTISTYGLSSKNIEYNIGCENADTSLYYANVGKYELTGLLTTKTIYTASGNSLITPSDYTDCLLNKLSQVDYFDSNTETLIYKESINNFDKTAVGLDYFYNVIKELNARIKELESASGSSNDPVDQIKLKIDGTDEYCIVKAKKDANGAITLALE